MQITINKMTGLIDKLIEKIEELKYEGLDKSLDESLISYHWVYKKVGNDFIILYYQPAEEYDGVSDEEIVEAPYIFIDKVDETDIEDKWDAYVDDIIDFNGSNGDMTKSFDAEGKLNEILSYGLVFHEILIQYRGEISDRFLNLSSNEYYVSGDYIQLNDEDSLKKIVNQL